MRGAYINIWCVGVWARRMLWAACTVWHLSFEKVGTIWQFCSCGAQGAVEHCGASFVLLADGACSRCNLEKAKIREPTVKHSSTIWHSLLNCNWHSKIYFTPISCPGDTGLLGPSFYVQFGWPDGCCGWNPGEQRWPVPALPVLELCALASSEIFEEPKMPNSHKIRRCFFVWVLVLRISTNKNIIRYPFLPTFSNTSGKIQEVS